MSKIKLSSGEFDREAYDPKDVMAVALRALHGITGGGGEGHAFDSGLTSEAICALAAMLIEALPAVKTNMDMRIMAEEAGGRIHAYVRTFRDTHAQTGRHAIEHMGIEVPPERGNMS